MLPSSHLTEIINFITLFIDSAKDHAGNKCRAIKAKGAKKAADQDSAERSSQ